MYKNFDPHKPYFYGVALATIIFGCTVLAIGIVEWVSNLVQETTYFVPSQKIIGGAAVIALGYIHLELELLRLQRPGQKGRDEY